jgi:L-seryl-tRNA(Ser) seleniumtransferase
VTAVAAQACNLEVDLAGGGRGERDAHVERLLCDLTGAEAAAVVNNNAAAVLLALNTLAEGREVVVSRGELVEIGGAFRIPDVLGKSGALLREVGTTNRTHARDYERAIGERTGLLLKVHPSNYRIAGFTAAVDLGALVDLGARRGVPVMEDLGSGALVDLTSYGLPPEPVVAERVRLGAAVVSFSADKLLGGPQAGILVGRASVIDRMRQNPLRRALRCDKLTLAALEATLRLYRTSPDLAAALPTLRWLTRPLAEMDTVGAVAVALLQRALGSEYAVQVVDAASQIGSGAQPTETLATKAVAITHATRSPLVIAAHFRASEPPIIGRVSADQFLLDLRCITHAADLVPRRVANQISTIKTPPHQEDA